MEDTNGTSLRVSCKRQLMQLRYPSSARSTAALSMTWLLLLSCLALEFYSGWTLANSARLGAQFLSQGAAVVFTALDPQGALASNGIRKGDRVLSIAGRPVDAAAFVAEPESSLHWSDRDHLYEWQRFLENASRDGAHGLRDGLRRTQGPMPGAANGLVRSGTPQLDCAAGGLGLSAACAADLDHQAERSELGESSRGPLRLFLAQRLIELYGAGPLAAGLGLGRSEHGSLRLFPVDDFDVALDAGLSRALLMAEALSLGARLSLVPSTVSACVAL